MKTINRFEAAFLTEKDVSEFTEPRYGFNEFLAKYSCISPKRFMSLFAKKANSDGFHRTVRFDQLSRHAVDSFGNKSDYIFEFTGLEYVPCKIEEGDGWVDYELIPIDNGSFSIAIYQDELLYAKQFLECVFSIS